MRLKLLLALSSCLLPLLLQAQDSLPQYAPANIPVITALRLETPAAGTPVANSLLSSEALVRDRQGMSLYEPLTLLPGLFALNPDNYTQDLRISVRGYGARAAFGIRGVRLMVDGIPESTPDGQGEVDNIDPLALQRAELIRSPAAGMYGNASGGVLAFETQSAQAGWQAAVQAGLGAYGAQRYLAQGGYGGKRWSTLGTLSYTGIGGYRAHSGMESTQYNLKTSFTPDSSSRLVLAFSGVVSPFADDPGGLTAEQVLSDRRQARPQALQFLTGEAVSQHRVGISYRKQHSHWQYGGKIYGAVRSLDNRLPFAASGAVVLRRSFGGGGIWMGRQQQFGAWNWLWQSGLDAEYQNDWRRRYDNNNGTIGKLGFDQREIFQNLAWWMTHSVKFRQWTLLGSLRADATAIRANDHFLDNGDQSGHSNIRQWSPMLGIDRQIARRQHLYANVATSFETPSLSELSNNPDGTGGFAALKPQHARSAELGWKGGFGSSFQISTTIFTIALQDEIVPYQLAGQPGRSFYRNAGSSLRKGLEISTQWSPWPDWALAGAYTWSDFRYRDYTLNGADFRNNIQPGIPQHFGSLEAQFHRKGLFASIQYRLNSAIWADDANTAQQPAYSWLGGRAGWQIRRKKCRIEPFLGADNLTNTLYNANIQINAAAGRYFEPAAGRRFYGGVRIEWAEKL